jgi:hypothetical protein
MRILIVLIGLLSLTGILVPKAQAQTAAQDSIVVKFGTQSKVVFLIRDEKDYKVLRELDLNQVAKDISNATLSQDGNQREDQILIGEEGSYIYAVARVTEKGDKIYARLGNWEVELDADWQSTGDDFTVQNVNSAKLQVSKQPGLRRERTNRNFFVDLGINSWSGDVTPISQNTLIDLSPDFTQRANQQQVRPWGSWNVALGFNNRTRVVGPFVLNYGGSFSWYNFKFEDRATTMVEVGDELYFMRRADVNGIKSKLAASHINLFLVPMFDFRYGKRSTVEQDGITKKYYQRHPGAFRIGAGPYVGHRLGGRMKYRFRDESGPNRIKDRDVAFLEDFRYGIRGQMGFRGINLYVNYDMSDLFRENTGVQLRPFSFGVIL